MAWNGCTVVYLPIPLAWPGWAGLVDMANGGWAEMRQEQSALRRRALGVGRWALALALGGGQRVWGLVETRGHVCRTRDGCQRADGDRRRKQQQPAPSFVKPVGKRT
jgi:hypothetical protein